MRWGLAPISLQVRSWPTWAMTGNGESGFDSGEAAWDTATMSTVSSRHVNCPILNSHNSEAATEHSTECASKHLRRNEGEMKHPPRIYLRASLVPAVAVTPAQGAYIYFVALRGLSVGCRLGCLWKGESRVPPGASQEPSQCTWVFRHSCT